jgi:hypothetical protein
MLIRMVATIVSLVGATAAKATSAGSTPAWLQVLAVLSPFLLLVTAGVGWLYRHERERRTSVENQLSEHKYRVYIELLNIFFESFKATRSERPAQPDSELVDRMMDVNKELMIYGSDDVALTYQKWLEASRKELAAGRNAPVRGFGEVVIAIRRDMGNRKTRMTPDNVLRQLVTDYDDAKAKGLI